MCVTFAKYLGLTCCLFIKPKKNCGGKNIWSGSCRTCQTSSVPLECITRCPLSGEGSRYVTVWRRKQKHGSPRRGYIYIAGVCGALWRGGHEPPSVHSTVYVTYTSDVSAMDTHAYQAHIHKHTHTYSRGGGSPHGAALPMLCRPQISQEFIVQCSSLCVYFVMH